ncbi:MAG: carboxypeptidase regulatory-like domain-containing protein [Desulfobulbaceae bacterium]|jgi:nickel transport protein|nr:carboxypeptidase regulatory-like domain-containing protein [Desulfobulbaceae bacterium]
MRKQPVATFLLSVLVFLSTTGLALAHKVNLFAYVEGETVFTESYFPDGKFVEDGVVEVFDKNNTKLLEGKTDAKGLFHFQLPRKEDLTIVINASMGHKNSFLLKASEM